MKCGNCGTEMNSEARFCPECGFKNEPAPETAKKFCAECGSVIDEKAAFCGVCGAKTTAQSAEDKASEKEKKSSATKIVLGVLLVLVVAASCGITSYFYFLNGADKNEKQNDEKQADVETEAREDAEVEKTKKNRVRYEETETDCTEALWEEDEYEEDEYEYLFPSDEEYITRFDLYDKTREEVALIRNEIYARHGYIFDNETYRNYFESKAWYEPCVPKEDFGDEMLNDIETTNRDFIVEYEKSKGWR